MLTLIFILALTLFCVSLLLLGLTMKIKLPFYSVTPDDFPDLYNSPANYQRNQVDLGKFTSKISNPPGQIEQYAPVIPKSQLLISYDQEL